MLQTWTVEMCIYIAFCIVGVSVGIVNHDGLSVFLSSLCLFDRASWISAPFLPGGIVEGQIAVASQV